MSETSEVHEVSTPKEPITKESPLIHGGDTDKARVQMSQDGKEDSRDKMISRSRSTKRELPKYLYYLGLIKGDLEGKTILDLGSGQNQIFAADIKTMRIKANVVSLDPKVAMSDLASKYEDYIDPLVKGTIVGALGQNLPFKDNSFDYVLALYSLPYYLHSESEIGPYLEEVCRVLKPGGEVIIFPLTYSDNESLEYSKEPDTYNPILDGLKNKGYEIATSVVSHNPVYKQTRLSIKKPFAQSAQLEKAA